MDKEIALKILRELHDKALFSERTALETLLPELKESEDERIKKSLIEFVKQSSEVLDKQNQNNMIAWLEKQGEQKVSIVDFKAEDWYVSKVDGKIYNAKFMEKTPNNQARRLEIEKAAMSATGIIEREEWFIKGAEWADENPFCVQIEKQGNTNETINRDEFAQGVLKGAAINLITWIDYNAAEGNMCLSNIECKCIEDALVNGDWGKIYAYMKKKLEKQGEQKPMTEEFEHELAEICNQLLSEIDSEWMNNEILDCIGTSVWLNLCDETAKRYKDGLLKLAKQGEQKPAEWSEEDETTFKVMLEELEKYVMFKQYSTPLSVYDLQWFKSLKDRIGG